MTDKNSPPQIGPRIQDIRKQKGFTLEQLASHSGVSRSMLSQIERGQANPTFATLWSLTQALGLEISDLTGGVAEVHHQAIEVMMPNFTPEIKSEDGLCDLKILSPTDQVGRVEWYEISIEAGGKLVSEPHTNGSMEHLTAFNGRFQVVSGKAKTEVPTGGTARYASDVSHTISNPGQETARGILVVVS
ncbi:helix-turn-helix domain-containing protein [Kordiimonas sp. SCSIO 12610]|uniref:helix-turn-helix domain-containing protein n=1 Tax=Kordiimonas sp. SCSIO 12610 TaxID=2829597 RepID=UPI00210DA651|nr:XRE family transcriptional regulator [Kordiimonas sp. SCSIO 12610]UTW55700.1 helix-turn-helix transcriptional regulator [Kordiimonas sp. SCSIO 12610]